MHAITHTGLIKSNFPLLRAILCTKSCAQNRRLAVHCIARMNELSIYLCADIVKMYQILRDDVEFFPELVWRSTCPNLKIDVSVNDLASQGS